MIITKLLSAAKSALAIAMFIAGIELLKNVYQVRTANDIQLFAAARDLAVNLGLSVSLLLLYNGTDAIAKELDAYDKYLDRLERSTLAERANNTDSVSRNSDRHAS